MPFYEYSTVITICTHCYQRSQCKDCKRRLAELTAAADAQR
jgi:hypothetical protein